MNFKQIFEEWPNVSLVIIILFFIIIVEIVLIIYKWFCLDRRQQSLKERQTHELWLPTPELGDEHSIGDELSSFSEEHQMEDEINVIIDSDREEKQIEMFEQDHLTPDEQVFTTSDDNLSEDGLTVAVIESHEEYLETEQIHDLPTLAMNSKLRPPEEVNDSEEQNDVMTEFQPNKRQELEKNIFEKSFDLIEEYYEDYRGLKNQYLEEFNSSKNGKINWSRVFSNIYPDIRCYNSAIEWSGHCISYLNSRKKLDIYLLVDSLIEIFIRENEEFTGYRNNNFFEQFNIIKSWQHFRRQ